MKFQEAVKLMEQGKICIRNNELKYKIENKILYYLRVDGDWWKSITQVLKLFESEWELVNEKKTLSSKIYITRKGAVLDVKDIKEHIKEFIDWLEKTDGNRLWMKIRCIVKDKAKEEF